jgi:hypothetical protein
VLKDFKRGLKRRCVSENKHFGSSDEEIKSKMRLEFVLGNDEAILGEKKTTNNTLELGQKEGIRIKEILRR